MKDVKLCFLIQLGAAAIVGVLLTINYTTWWSVTENKDDVSKEVSIQQSSIKVLLVTFYRGGSSFLGQAFNLNPRAFYYYEPLASIYWKAKLHESQLRRNELTVPESVVSEAVHHIDDLLNCRLAGLRKTLFLWKSQHLSTYRKCIKIINSTSSLSSTKKECLNDVTAACQNSHIRAAKTIRMELSMLPRLLDLDPDIKVVYYVRDPRGIIRSRQMGSELNNSASIMSYLTRGAKGVCMRISRDLEELRKLKQVFGNIWLMKYEDLAGDNVNVLPTLYGYLGLKVPSGVSAWFNASSNGKDEDDVTEVSRGNSAQIAERWREKLPLYIQDLVTNICEPVLVPLGYI